MTKRTKVLSLLLALVMVISLMPTVALATGGTEDDFYKIVHVDAGRKYFSPENIKKIIDEAAAAGFNQVELYLSDNQGFRFALDDMTITTAYGTYDLTPALGDGYSDGSKYPDYSGKYLTQSEMTEIISYAAGKGIDIVPCINVPGHMGAILEEFTSFRYTSGSQTSKSSIDLANEEAVAFALAITQKYVTYFASQGVKYYNIGADEYANDLSSMGFEGMGSTLYTKFVEFLNSAADIIINAGMTPRAFNDGFLYKDYSINETPNTKYQICYWTSGWNNYDVASASTLDSAGYDLINTHGDYYWVLGNTSWQCSVEKASQFDINSFQGGTISDPAGAMFCIWCDVGNANGTDDGAAVVSATADVIAAFGAALPASETPAEESVTKTDTTTGVSVTAPGLTGLTVETVDAPAYSAEGAEVVGYNITPYVGDTAYTAGGKVGIAVPEELSGFDRIMIYDAQEQKFLESAVSDGIITFTATHFSEYDVVAMDEGTVPVTENKTITVTVGGTATATISGANYAGTYTTEDLSIATVEVTGTDATEATTTYKEASVTCNTLISSDKSSWTAVSGYYYTPDGTNYYPLYAKRSSSSFLFWTRYTYTWGYSTDSSGNVNEIGTQETDSTSTTANITVYTKSGTEGTPASTTVTFKGVAVGTTYVTVGNTRYTINVVAEDLSTVTPLTVEFWITNMPVTADGATSKSISAQSAYGEAGVDISTLVPATGTYEYGSVVFWKGTVLDSSNKQTSASGSENDKTGSGKDFSLIRYYNGNWQYYYEADGTWNTISSTDQVVIYWLQPTEVTKEITTLVKDWGFTPSNQGDTANKVALTVAVVYPDGTVSPAESDMYSTSTTLFNYWKDRDIGIVAPVNNSDYEIAKITVTDGTRDQSGTGKWGTNDTITWEKVTLEDNSTWYNETTYWDEDVGGTPMVNGATSNITWSNYNTAKLVLIYLKPIQKDTNLNLVYWDDSANAEIASSQIVMSYKTGDPVPTYYSALKQTSALPDEGVGGTFILDDNAYVTNSSNVNQTFNKNISTVTGVADVYKTGLYYYVSAELSADGKTLTLHYNIDSSKLSKQYVVDFGLPVNVPLSALVEDASVVKQVEITRGDATVNDDKSITYQPEAMLTGTAIVRIKLTFNDNTTQTVSIRFIPATTVYYEDSFVNFSDGWNKVVDENYSSETTIPQALEELGSATNVYGYDYAYSSFTKYSLGSAMKTTVSPKTGTWPTATFTFKGTGFDIISLTDSDSGAIFVTVTDAYGETVKQLVVNNYYGYTYENGEWKVTPTADNALYQVPVMKVSGLAYGEYKVEIKVAYDILFDPVQDGSYSFWLDAIRIYDTLDPETSDIYENDGEASPSYQRIKSIIIDAGEYNNYDSKIDGAVFIDGMSTGASVEQYANYGPNNETYLAQNQAVAFKLIATAKPTEVQIGVKLALGTSATVNGSLGMTITTATDMYYSLSDLSWNDDDNDGKWVSDVITIGNNSTTNNTIVSLTNIKITGGAKFAALSEVTESTGEEALVAAFVDGQTVEEAVKLLNETPEEPVAPNPGGGADTPDEPADDEPADDKPWENPYGDVDENEWYYDFIKTVSEKELMNGVGTGFDPNGKLSRGMLVTILYRMSGAEKVEAEHKFEDVENDKWYTDAVAWAYANGIVTGYSETQFAPNRDISRQEMAAIIARYAAKFGIELSEADGTLFADDAAIADYARDAVYSLKASGILSGKGSDLFDPQGTTTRAEAAKVIALLSAF